MKYSNQDLSLSYYVKLIIWNVLIKKRKEKVKVFRYEKKKIFVPMIFYQLIANLVYLNKIHTTS